MTTPTAWHAYAARVLERERPVLDYWEAIMPLIDPDQAWFWTKEWQAGERAADADIAASRIVSFDTVDDAIAWLKSDA